MKSILLIDDNEDLRGHLRDGIAAAGYNVVEVADGVQGMTKFSENRPDLVITDIFMPRKEGLGILLEIQKVAPETPIIVISGHKDYLRMSRGLGADDALLKPFRMPRLLMSIENALATRS